MAARMGDMTLRVVVVLVAVLAATLVHASVLVPGVPSSVPQRLGQAQLVTGWTAHSTPDSSSTLVSVSSGMRKTHEDTRALAPLIGGALLLDRDVSATVFTEEVSGGATRTYTFDYDPAVDFAVVTLNASVSSLRMSYSIGEQSQSAQDVSQAYLESTTSWRAAARPFQTFTLKPSVHLAECKRAYPDANIGEGIGALCRVTISIRRSRDNPSNPSSTVPFRLSILPGDMLPWGGDRALKAGVPSNRSMTFGLEISGSDLAVLLQLLPTQASGGRKQRVDTMLYMYNSANPLQYFAPNRNFKTHLFGTATDYVLPEGYAGAPVAPPAAGGGGATPVVYDTPEQGGHQLADANFESASRGGFRSALYLLTVVPSPGSAPDPADDLGARGLHGFEIYVVRNWSDEPKESGFGLTTFGIVGALTVLVLCIFSAAAIVIKRRAAANAASIEGINLGFGGAGVAGMVQLTRQQRAELPSHGPDGRPLRYDAYGRPLADLGASAAQIRALPSRTFGPELAIPPEDAQCTICLGEYVPGESITDLPCGHMFHSPCIEKWLSQKKHCVLCQQDIDHASNYAANNKNNTNSNNKDAPPPQQQQASQHGTADLEAAPLTARSIAATELSPSPPAGAAFIDAEEAANSWMSQQDQRRILDPAGAPDPATAAAAAVALARTSGGGATSPHSDSSTSSSSSSSSRVRRDLSARGVVFHSLEQPPATNASTARSARLLPPLVGTVSSASPAPEQKEEEERLQQQQQAGSGYRSPRAGGSGSGDKRVRRQAGSTSAGRQPQPQPQSQPQQGGTTVLVRPSSEQQQR